MFYLDGIEPVRVGMSIAQAEAAAGIKLTQPDSKQCSYVRPQGSNYDVLFLVINNRIARIDVRGNSRVSTVMGARIGDTESKIKSLYPEQIRVTRHHYQSKGHYLTFTPKDRREANYRIVFETDGNRLTGNGERAMGNSVGRVWGFKPPPRQSALKPGLVSLPTVPCSLFPIPYSLFGHQFSSRETA